MQRFFTALLNTLGIFNGGEVSKREEDDEALTQTESKDVANLQVQKVKVDDRFWKMDVRNKSAQKHDKICKWITGICKSS